MKYPKLVDYPPKVEEKNTLIQVGRFSYLWKNIKWHDKLFLWLKGYRPCYQCRIWSKKNKLLEYAGRYFCYYRGECLDEYRKADRKKRGLNG